MVKADPGLESWEFGKAVGLILRRLFNKFNLLNSNELKSLILSILNIWIFYNGTGKKLVDVKQKN